MREVVKWLFSWEVSSVVVAVLVGAALAVLGWGDCKRAKLFFLVAGADAIGSVSMWTAHINTVPTVKYSCAFILVGIIGAFTFMSMKYVEKRAQLEQAQTGPIGGVEIEAQLSEINDFICRKSELELRETFDFPQMLKYNIKFVKRNLVQRQISKEESAQIDEFFRNGNGRLDTRYANIRSINNRAHIDWIPGKIGVINTSARYGEARKKLSSLAASALLPTNLTAALRDFDDTVERDSTLMIESLNQSLAVNPRHIVENDVDGSNWYGSASGLYWSQFVPLRPKADAVTAAIRQVVER